MVRCRRPCRPPGCSSGGGPGSGGPGRTASWCAGRRDGRRSGRLGDRRRRRNWHGRDKCMAQHVRVRPDDVDAGGLGEVPQAAGGGVPVHPGAVALSRIGPRTLEPTARSMARPTAGGSGTRTILVPLPHTRSTRWPCSSPRSAMSAAVASKIRKPSSPSMATSAKSCGFADSRAAVSRASNCRWVNPRVGDSAGTTGRRTCSAGECSRNAVKNAGPVKTDCSRLFTRPGRRSNARYRRDPAPAE